jgi:hypothetical protein
MLGQGQFFGHDPDIRPGTSHSHRSNFRTPKAPYMSRGGSSSMTDLSSSGGHGRGPSASSLRLNASNANLHTKWNNSSATNLIAPPGPGYGSRPGTPNGQQKKNWVNPLDVHFCRDVPSPAPSPGLNGPKSPLGQFEFSTAVKDEMTDRAEMAHGRYDAGPTNPGSKSPPKLYPSPPESLNGFDRAERNVLASYITVEPAMSNGRKNQPSNLREVRNLAPNPTFPTELPSPAASLSRPSDEENENGAWSGPVIQNVHAKRDTLTIAAPRRQSVSMDIEEPGRSGLNFNLDNRPSTSHGTGTGSQQRQPSPPMDGFDPRSQNSRPPGPPGGLWPPVQGQVRRPGPPLNHGYGEMSPYTPQANPNLRPQGDRILPPNGPVPPVPSGPNPGRPRPLPAEVNHRIPHYGPLPGLRRPPRLTQDSDRPPSRGNNQSPGLPPPRLNFDDNRPPSRGNNQNVSYPPPRVNFDGDRPPSRGNNHNPGYPPPRPNFDGDRPPSRGNNQNPNYPPPRFNLDGDRPPSRGNNQNPSYPPPRPNFDGDRPPSRGNNHNPSYPTPRANLDDNRSPSHNNATNQAYSPPHLNYDDNRPPSRNNAANPVYSPPRPNHDDNRPPSRTNASNPVYPPPRQNSDEHRPPSRSSNPNHSFKFPNWDADQEVQHSNFAAPRQPRNGGISPPNDAGANWPLVSDVPVPAPLVVNSSTGGSGRRLSDPSWLDDRGRVPPPNPSQAGMMGEDDYRTRGRMDGYRGPPDGYRGPPPRPRHDNGLDFGLPRATGVADNFGAGFI